MAKRKSKITIFAILTTITIFVWVSFEAYQRFNKKDFQSIPENIIAPIAPSLDTEVLDNINGKLWFSDNSSIPPPATRGGVEQKPTPAPKEASPSSEATRSAQ